MQIETETGSDSLIVRAMEPRLDAAAAVQFKDAIRAVLPEAPRRVVLDLERVVFLDSSGLGAIIGAMKLLAPERTLELNGSIPASPRPLGAAGGCRRASGQGQPNLKQAEVKTPAEIA